MNSSECDVLYNISIPNPYTFIALWFTNAFTNRSEHLTCRCELIYPYLSNPFSLGRFFFLNVFLMFFIRILNSTILFLCFYCYYYFLVKKSCHNAVRSLHFQWRFFHWVQFHNQLNTIRFVLYTRLSSPIKAYRKHYIILQRKHTQFPPTCTPRCFSQCV